MKSIIRRIFNKAGFVRKSECDSLRQELAVWKTGFVQPGHYYSPINDVPALLPMMDHFYSGEAEIRDIDFQLEKQFEFTKKLATHYGKIQFPELITPGFRYYFQNNLFSYSDALFLSCFLAEVRPAKCIEIGSGFSSALMLDTNERLLDNNISFSFIEPFPEERLLKLIRKEEGSRVYKEFIQNVDLSLFRQLDAGDILFVDSSHVSKFQSDLNHIMFNILPTLKDGVYIHFHDIFYPFEYPREWIGSGRAWNEAYLLRAFLMNNNSYEIVLFPSMLEKYHGDWLQQNMPLVMKPHEKWPDEQNFKYLLPHRGQSIWLRKKSTGIETGPKAG